MTFLKTAMVAGVMFLSPAPGFAGLEICNDTEVRQTVAVGYKSGDDWVSEGWWNIGAGKCSTPISGDLKQRFYYYMAKSSGWSFEDENYRFCTESTAFTIKGDEKCADRGFDSSRFRKVDTGKTAKHHKIFLAAYSTPTAPAAAPAPAPSAATPGTYGEPYSDNVNFQECVLNDGSGRNYCAFFGSGTKFFVYDDGRTPRVVFAILKVMDPGTPLVVEGDLESIHDSTADVVLRDVTVRSWTNADAALQRMQGQWYSVDDPNAQFTVLGSERTNTYDGAVTSLDFISIQDRCDSFEGAGPYLYARDAETGEYYCYAIDSIDETSMALMFLPGGNFLDYRKLD